MATVYSIGEALRCQIAKDEKAAAKIPEPRKADLALEWRELLRR